MRTSRFLDATLPWTRHSIFGRNIPAAIPSWPVGRVSQKVMERGREGGGEGREGEKEVHVYTHVHEIVQIIVHCTICNCE